MHRSFLVLSIVGEEVTHFVNGLFQDLDSGQVDNAEMIRLMPVKALAADEQYLLFTQKIKSELLIIGDIELFGIQLGENVEAGLGFHGADAGNIVESLVDIFSLLIDSAAGGDVGFDTLIAAQSGLHDGLGRHIGAKTHVGEHVKSLDIISAQILVAA